MANPFDALLLMAIAHARDMLRGNLLLKQHQLEVDLRHVGLYNDELAHAIQDKPAEVLPLVSNQCYYPTSYIDRHACAVRECSHKSGTHHSLPSCGNHGGRRGGYFTIDDKNTSNTQIWT